VTALPPFPLPRAWVPKPSPNHGPRPAGVVPTAIILHADASRKVDATLGWLAQRESRVSYHLVVGRTGTVFLIVPPERRAWHAGVSALDGVRDCNDFTIGVCLSNANDGEELYPEAQVVAAVDACRLLMRHFDIPWTRVRRHRDVALPRGRKTDPAPPAFNFARFLDLLAHRAPPAPAAGLPVPKAA
jgi:N-acetylmuramoyl-L-alanine amidase